MSFLLLGTLPIMYMSDTCDMQPVLGVYSRKHKHFCVHNEV